jgi:hypothetical protein
MKSPFIVAIVVAFASISAISSSAQQISSDVAISGATLNDGYQFAACDDDGQFYRRPTSPRPWIQPTSLIRVAKDGSTLLFTLPKPEWAIEALAPTATGVAVLTDAQDAAERGSMHMYRFDRQGTIQTERTVALDFLPVAMAETKSGMTIVVGYRERMVVDKAVKTYGGAVLNASDRVVQSFEFSPTTDGKKWATAASHRMAGGNNSVSVILESGDDPIYSIASISESGEVRVLPLATVRGARFHDWFFGNGVAVEEYQFASDKPMPPIKMDAFDLISGRKISTKTLPIVGFGIACYLGDEVSNLATSVSVAKSRGIPADALRLVTVKLLD